MIWMLAAVPVILILGGLGLAAKSPKGIIIGKLIFEFREYERGVVFRFGKFHRVVGPGWVFVIPTIEKFVLYDLRTETIDIPPQEVITKDAVKLLIDAVIFMRVEDPVKAELYVEEDYRKAVEEYTKGRIRNVIGSVELGELYAKIGEINETLKKDVQNIAERWGVMITDIELIDVTPPPEVVEAMQAQEIAERYKAAAAEEAKTTQIRIGAIQEAAGKLTAPALTYLYLNALKDIANGQASKLIFPLEFSKLAEGISKGIGGKATDLEALAEKVLVNVKG
ncbi:MAG: SPFH domain-containing protein [archaeon]